MNNTQPLSSVIILCYNQEHTVAQTIESILSQRTNFAFEIIIGEDASPSDNTRTICEAYATKHPDLIRLMPKAPNKGLLHNYIDCLKECRGKYIAGCAGDDWWCDPNKLQTQVDFLETHPDYVLVHTEMRNFDVSCGKFLDNLTRRNVPQGDVRLELYQESFVKAPTACYRRDAVNAQLLDDLYAQNFAMEDLPLWLILSQQGKFHYLPHQTVAYRIDESSASNGRTVERQLAFMESVMVIKRYYFDKFKPNFSFSTIQRAHNNRVIRTLITSHDWSFVRLAIKQFGFFKTLRVFCSVAIEKVAPATPDV